MKVVVYGNSEIDKMLVMLIDNSFKEVEVTCIESRKEICEKYAKGEIQRIILSSKCTVQDMHRKNNELIKAGIHSEDIFVVPINTINRFQYKEQLAVYEDVFVKVDELVQIHGLNVHVADHCNFRCKACSHSAPLVKGEVFPSVEQYRHDLSRLHELCENICSIILLGGEPLLNPELPEFIRISKETYPDAGIRIITNGSLLFKMSEELVSEIIKNRVKVTVSVYPHMVNKVDEYKKILEDKCIRYNIEYCGKFEKKLTSNSYFNGKLMADNCPECVSLRNGKINRCVMSMYIDYFNSYFNTNYPCEGINLYQQDMDSSKFKEQLWKPLQLCNYCSQGYFKEEIDCEQVKGKIEIEDWLIR